MKIILFGGSGFLGRHLLSGLSARGHQVTVVTRRPNFVVDTPSPSVTVKTWFPLEDLHTIMDGADVVVNLVGESIGAKRWSESRKLEILSSRIDSTRVIVDAIGKASRKPKVLLSSSAVGYYGNIESGDVTEDHPPGTDFLASVCVQWEDEAKKAGQFHVRVVIPRSGVVLARDAEAFKRMVLPFKLFAGGTLGSGRQWFPWIHIDDETNAMIHLLENSTISGPVNLVAPEAVRMKEFCSTLAKSLHRPSWAPVPAFVLRLVLGQMADALVLGGQKAVPTKLLQGGYSFRFPILEEALGDVVR